MTGSALSMRNKARESQYERRGGEYFAYVRDSRNWPKVSNLRGLFSAKLGNSKLT
jgi:hypothetical protein